MGRNTCTKEALTNKLIQNKTFETGDWRNGRKNGHGCNTRRKVSQTPTLHTPIRVEEVLQKEQDDFSPNFAALDCNCSI